MNGKTTESFSTNNGDATDLAMTEKRLQLIYPGKHELRISEEPEIMIVSLKLHLTKMVAEEKETLPESINGLGQLKEALT